MLLIFTAEGGIWWWVEMVPIFNELMRRNYDVSFPGVLKTYLYLFEEAVPLSSTNTSSDWIIFEVLDLEYRHSYCFHPLIPLSFVAWCPRRASASVSSIYTD